MLLTQTFVQINQKLWSVTLPSRPTLLTQHWFNVDSTSWRWNNVESMLSQQCVPAGWIIILICCSRKKGFRNLFAFTIEALTYTYYVPAGLAHFAHSASIVWNRKTKRSLVRGRGTSIAPEEWLTDNRAIRKLTLRYLLNLIYLE